MPDRLSVGKSGRPNPPDSSDFMVKANDNTCDTLEKMRFNIFS